MNYERFGDISNSDFFEEYLGKIYTWREGVGLHEMIREMHSFTVEVGEEDRHTYIEELSLMTPYRFRKSYENEQFRYSLLEIDQLSPGFIIRSRKNPEKSPVRAMNSLSPVSMKKPNTRYIGEVYRVTDFEKVTQILEKSGVEFDPDSVSAHSRIRFCRTSPSQYTWNTVAYIQYQGKERQYYLEQFPELNEPEGVLVRFDEIKKKQSELGIDSLIKPIDHLATRVLHQDREHAILEHLKLTSYYYWGSYDIADQNSSTNVTRNSLNLDESVSPARVFTAANTPHYLDHIVQLPSPTESFVLHYGKRMHHIAYGVADNAEGQTHDNIDIVVDTLKDQGMEFLLKVIGSAEEGLKQIFSRTSNYSLLITEYVQRYNGFQGFFTKKNVAFLTEAAGQDEALQKMNRVGEKDLCD
ncbi:MAG: hypothetical protein Q8O95_05225 [bacterium]|nr:hypothetical protein [bacterium]